MPMEMAGLAGTLAGIAEIARSAFAPARARGRSTRRHRAADAASGLRKETGVQSYWYWLIGGVLLCAAEAMAPGMFLLWLGVAAIATGLLLIAIDLSFAWQLLAFGALAVAAVLIGRRFYGSSERESDQPFLNRRAEALVGRTFVLAQPIKAGEGR